MQTSNAGPGVLRVAVDIGGTFTDGIAALMPSGRMWAGKTPTTPDDPGKAVSEVIEDLLCQVHASLGVQAPPLFDVVHGTTLVTNTLIERKGVPTALVTTRGMRDVLTLAREQRYDIYDLDIVLPAPLVPNRHRIEVDERLDADGNVLAPLNENAKQALLQALRSMDVQSVAVSFLHSYVNDAHEQEVARYLESRLPGMAVSISSELAREINEFERTSTVAANAYVKPIVARYLEELESRIAAIKPKTPLRIMVSSGGFTSAQAGARAPIQLLESGPAAGVLSAVNLARQHGMSEVLAFDMGGTTAKACVVLDSTAPIAHSFECARVERFKRGSGLPIRIPSIELIEIGAGGGSIAHANSMGLLNVGPESSGSVPGPACYDRGGLEPTVTDADLLLGYLDAEHFLGGTMRLRPELAAAAMTSLSERLGVDADAVARGIYDMVNENMASAARIHIAEQGHDPREFAMVATGGAGPVHAVEVARRLRIPQVLIPVGAGAGSCLGMLAAPARADRSWSHPQLLANVDWTDVAQRAHSLREDASRELAAVGVSTSEVTWQLGAEIRYYGQGYVVSVQCPYRNDEDVASAPLLAAFEDQYRKLYGALVDEAVPEVLTWRLTGSAHTAPVRFEWGDKRTAPAAKKQAPRCSRSIYAPGKGHNVDAPVYERYALPPGTTLAGPLILEERESTIVVAVHADVLILDDRTVSVSIKEFQ
ncbi:hydantoinase/oxoprolinase family protein [Bordetella genomosp. 8]|uniref:hydantoinase/oxoprolinase family protein n=1 Tax=Bordetella genomosp. 8 TaxID=1416806 RepID=UPI001E640C66|nr:hydantoinase/oxoprolinase family protein [Bordetella genomosp. 8]